jgi:TfoX/Sxy family transcriptional regulator of competence genes
MAYDVDLADRIRAELAGSPGVTEKRMFGGLAFLIDGRLTIAASSQGGALVRVDPAGTAQLLARTTAEPAVMRGREMAGWLRVPPHALRTRRQLAPWVARSSAYVRSLAP